MSASKCSMPNSITLTAIDIIKTHRSGATTEVTTLEAVTKVRFNGFDEAAALTGKPGFIINDRSKGIGVAHRFSSDLTDDGTIIERVKIVRPSRSEVMSAEDYARSHWTSVTEISRAVSGSKRLPIAQDRA